MGVLVGRREGVGAGGLALGLRLLSLGAVGVVRGVALAVRLALSVVPVPVRPLTPAARHELTRTVAHPAQPLSVVGGRHGLVMTLGLGVDGGAPHPSLPVAPGSRRVLPAGDGGRGHGGGPVLPVHQRSPHAFLGPVLLLPAVDEGGDLGRRSGCGVRASVPRLPLARPLAPRLLPPLAGGGAQAGAEVADAGQVAVRRTAGVRVVTLPVPVRPVPSVQDVLRAGAATRRSLEVVVVGGVGVHRAHSAVSCSHGGCGTLGRRLRKRGLAGVGVGTLRHGGLRRRDLAGVWVVGGGRVGLGLGQSLVERVGGGSRGCLGQGRAVRSVGRRPLVGRRLRQGLVVRGVVMRALAGWRRGQGALLRVAANVHLTLALQLLPVDLGAVGRLREVAQRRLVHRLRLPTNPVLHARVQLGLIFVVRDQLGLVDRHGVGLHSLRVHVAGLRRQMRAGVSRAFHRQMVGRVLGLRSNFGLLLLRLLLLLLRLPCVFFLAPVHVRDAHVAA